MKILPKFVNKLLEEYDNRISGVTLEEVRFQLGIYDDDSLDDRLTNIIEAAESLVSSFVGYSINAAKYNAFYDTYEGRLELPTESVNNITCSIFTTNGVVAVSGEKIKIDPTSKLITIRIAGKYELDTDIENPVMVDYDTGLPEDRVTPGLKEAVLILCRTLYSSGSDVSLQTIPPAVQALLTSYKRKFSF